MICFVHIARTGGSTIHASFYPILGPDRWRVYGHSEPMKELRPQIKASDDRNWYIGGHFSSVDLDEFIGLESSDFLISVVRDPIERFSSLHRLLTRSPEWLPKVKQAIGRDLAYFYECCIDNQLLRKNVQCVSISGHDKSENAIASLSRYDCVGSMGDFSDFLRILEAEFPRNTGISFKYLDTNHNAADATGFEVSPSLRAKIEKDFEEDFMLVAEVERRQAAMLRAIQDLP